MSEDVMRKHIDLYVNNFSIDLGTEGKQAVSKFLEVYSEIHQSTFSTAGIFAEG
jgi:1,4-dihydroxy-6-naphthoate synthase